MKYFNINGYLIQRKSDLAYQGVEGDNWYLDDDYFKKYTYEKIEKSWYIEDYLDCCNDENFINEYIKISEERGLDYRVIICCSEMNNPQIELNLNDELLTFIGYDYAYPGGDYYSCINNDIYRIKEFCNIKLNKYGLFETLEECERFIELRNQLKLIYDDKYFEKGNFIIYKLYERK